MGKQFYQRLIFALFGLSLTLTVPFLWQANESQEQQDLFFQLEAIDTKDEVLHGQESKLVSEWSAEALMKRDVSTMLYFSNKDWPSFSPENRGTCPHKLSYYIPDIPITFTTEVRGFVQEHFLDNHTFVPTDIAMEMGILQLFETSPCRTYNSTEADLYVIPYMHSTDCVYHFIKHYNGHQDSCKQVTTKRIKDLRASVPESVPIERQVFIGMQHEDQTRDYLRLYDDREIVPNMIKAKVTTGDRQRNGIFAMPNLNLFPRFQPSIMSKLDELWWTRPRKYAFAAIYGGLNYRMGRRAYQPRCMRLFFFEQLERHHNNTEDFAGTGLPYLASLTNGKLKKLESKGYDYDDSILCPILAGDSPYLTRFFDVMLKGCIPVVPEFHLKKPGLNSEILRGEKMKSWWLPEAITPCLPRRDMSKRSFSSPISNIVEAYPFISSLSTFNNTNDSKNQEWAVDYRSFVVVAPMIEGKDQDFTPMFEAMEKVLKNPEELRRRQLNMKKYILRFTLGLGLDAHKYGDSFDSLLKLFELYKDGL